MMLQIAIELHTCLVAAYGDACCACYMQQGSFGLRLGQDFEHQQHGIVGTFVITCHDTREGENSHSRRTSLVFLWSWLSAPYSQ
eukprot:4794168-Amphidinium_carterae.1